MQIPEMIINKIIWKLIIDKLIYYRNVFKFSIQLTYNFYSYNKEVSSINSAKSSLIPYSTSKL